MIYPSLELHKVQIRLTTPFPHYLRHPQETPLSTSGSTLTMLIFIPLLFAYATVMSSILILRVPIPTPSPAHPSLSYAPFPLLSVVSVVEEINTVIKSFPTFPGLVYYPATWTAPSARYIDASPVSPNAPSPNSPSPNSPSPNLPTCAPLDWPPLSDFGYSGSTTCNRITSTDLVLWDGPSDSPDLLIRLPPTDGDYAQDDTRFFITLVASGIGFWLMCRLTAIAILKWFKSTSTEARLAEFEAANSVNILTKPTETSPKPLAECVGESVERSREVKALIAPLQYVPAELEPMYVSPPICQCTSMYNPSPDTPSLIFIPLSSSRSPGWAIHHSPVYFPLFTVDHHDHSIEFWSSGPPGNPYSYNVIVGNESTSGVGLRFSEAL
ncbi:hypothetical protein BJ322DRAFT_544124 [Thelephora terrestris]|uniref:Uncharacterized protein n=1 Tax=Thelephora terrestris TaxID=56493 RepID=A0A9P6HL08_9AGAM|nr:hypothetical protein BJ322DRAFT_544124 [Thelephora terrestris]